MISSIIDDVVAQVFKILNLNDPLLEETVSNSVYDRIGEKIELELSPGWNE